MPRPTWATQESINVDHGVAWDRGAKMGLPPGSYLLEITDLVSGVKPDGKPSAWAEFTVVGGDGGDAVLGRTHQEFYTLTDEAIFTWGQLLRAITEEAKAKAWPKGTPLPAQALLHKRLGARVEQQKNPSDGKMYSRIAEYWPANATPPAASAVPTAPPTAAFSI